MATASGAHNSSGLEGSDHFLDAFKWELRDERADGWLLLSSVWPTVALSSTYVLLVTVVGPWFMRNRKAYDVKPVLIVYNAIQILISLYLLYGMSVHGWMTGEYSTICQPVDKSTDINSHGYKMLVVGYHMFLFRFIEFMDTFFFIAKKKFGHVSSLQIIHHSITPIYGWFMLRYVPGGNESIVAVMNASVHVVMYTYYLLAALGPHMRPYLWWKRYLTNMQIIQFIIAFFKNLIVATGIVSCGYPWQFAVLTCSIMALFFGLFSDFYLKEYLSKTKKQK